MSDVKQLPDNINELEKDAEFKKVYKKYTVDELEIKLIEREVEFLSADNKPDLVWRLLDAQGYTFGVINDANNQEDSQSDSHSSADATHINGGDTTATGSDNRDSNTGNHPESLGENGVKNDETLEANDTKAQGDDTVISGYDSGQDSGSSDTKADSASNSDSQEDSGMVDTTVSDAPSNTSNNNDASADKTNQLAKTDNNTAAHSAAPNNKTTTQAPVSKTDYVEVKNNGGFNMLEPATGTLVAAGKTTKIYIKAYASKDQVLRNIEQYNHTRGNKLTITNQVSFIEWLQLACSYSL